MPKQIILQVKAEDKTMQRVLSPQEASAAWVRGARLTDPMVFEESGVIRPYGAIELMDLDTALEHEGKKAYVQDHFDDDTVIYRSQAINYGQWGTNEDLYVNLYESPLTVYQMTKLGFRVVGPS